MKQPTGPQLGRVSHWHNRLPECNRPGQELAVGPGAIGTPPSPGNADPGIDGGASTRSFNAQSQEIRVAERSGQIRDLTAVRCRSLRQTRRQVTRQLCLPYSLQHGRRLSDPGQPEMGSRRDPAVQRMTGGVMSAMRLPNYPGLTL